MTGGIPSPDSGLGWAIGLALVALSLVIGGLLAWWVDR